MKLTKYVVEALQVIEAALDAEVEVDKKRVEEATNRYDRLDWEDNLYQSLRERDLFAKSVRENNTEELEYFLSVFQERILQAPFAQAFIARQTTPRRRLFQKAERLKEIKRRDHALTMKMEIGLLRFGSRGPKWQDLDTFTRAILEVA